jgi:RNA polymerase sigma-70 factor (ECF subfamily)
VNDLVALMQAGDPAALDRLARAYGPRLLAVARRCCRSSHDAEDAVQQALVSASSSMGSYRGEGSPIAWLSTLVARSCFRMNREAHNDPARTSHSDDVDGACSCSDPEERAAQAELAEKIGVALMKLSRTDRLAFLLAVEGETSEEIAHRFGLTPSAVRSRLKRARQKLRDTLEPVRGTPAHEAHQRRHA